MANPFDQFDETTGKEINPFDQFDEIAISEITPPSELNLPVTVDTQTEMPELSSRKTDLPIFSSADIMAGINEGGLSESARNAALELRKRGRIGEGTISYLESLKLSRLKKDIVSIDKPAPQPGIDLWEMATGAKRETELTKTLPEFRETAPVQDPQMFEDPTVGGGFIESLPSLTDKDLGLSAGLMFSLSDQDAMDVIKNAIPEAEFIKDEKGNVIVEVDGQLSVLNKPGWSKQDSVKAVTQFLTFLAPAKLASLGTSLLARVGIGAVTSGLAEAGIQEVEQAAGVTKERDPARIALATGLGGASELIGPAYRGQKQFRADRALRKEGGGITDVPETIRTAKEAVEGVEAFTGVDVPLYKPQQTLTPSDVKLMRFMPQLDATSQQASAALSKQSKKVKEAVDSAVETLIPDEVMNAPEGLRTAAGRAIEGKKLIRKEASSPLFNESKKEVVDVSNVVKLIDDEMKPFLGKSNIKTQLQKIKGNITKVKAKDVTKEDVLLHDPDVGKTYTDADIAEYNLAIQRSQEIARDKIKDTYLKQDKDAYKDAVNQAKKNIDESGTYQEISEAVRQGGLKLETAKMVSDDVTLNELMKRRPGLFKKGGNLNADEFANENGFDTADEMFQEWLKAGTKKDAITKMADDLYNEYGMWSDVERGLENQEMFIGLESEAFNKLLLKKPPKSASKIKNIVEKVVPKKETEPTTIAELQKAKATIDDILNVNVGDSALKGDSRRIVTKIKEELLTAMDGAGAATPEEAVALRGKVKGLMDRVQKGEVVTPEEIAELPVYGQARIKFAQASPDVVALEKGLVGKLAKADDLQVEQIANRIFDPKLREQTIKNAKIVLDGVDPEIFPQILKFKLLDNLSKMKPARSGSIENVASKTRRALFGNQPQKDALMAGMSTDQKRNFNYLDEMLARASEGRAEGSPTASFQELMKNIRSVPMFLQKLLTVNIGEVRNIGKQGVLDMRLKGLAKMVYDDSWASELARVRQMNPNTAAAGKAFAQLLDNIGIKEE